MGNIFNKTNKLTNASFDVQEFTLNNTITQCKVVYVYDGDTIHIVLRHNNKLTRFICRMNMIDCPEICPKNTDIKNTNDIETINKLKTIKNLEIKSAIESKYYLLKQVVNIPIINYKMTKKEIKSFCAESEKLMWVKCLKFDKYGRLLIELFNSKNDKISINQLMIDNKYAITYNGGTKKIFSVDDYN